MNLRCDRKSKSYAAEVDEDDENADFFSISQQPSKTRLRKGKKAYVNDYFFRKEAASYACSRI